MRWLILTSIVGFEFFLVVLALQVIVRSTRYGFRWPAWVVVLGGMSLGLFGLCHYLIGQFRPDDLWETRAELFSLHDAYPTFRLYLFVTCSSLPFW
jgi:hypothetical protein